MQKITNKNEIILSLEKILMEEYSNITIGDDSETNLLKIRNEKDMYLENVIICLYNRAKINQYKVKMLETNLDLLASRVYNTEENFTQDEKDEIVGALETLKLEQLKDIENNKDYLQDMLYCDGIMEEDEEYYEECEKLSKQLMSKIKYQTPKMNKTFMELVKGEIENNESSFNFSNQDIEIEKN